MIYLDFAKITQNAIFASRGKGTTCTAYTMVIFTDWFKNIFKFFHGLITYSQNLRFFRDPKIKKSDFLFLSKNELSCTKKIHSKIAWYIVHKNSLLKNRYRRKILEHIFWTFSEKSIKKSAPTGLKINSLFS